MDSSSENQPCPIQFYCFSHLEHKKHCPVYSSIVDRSAANDPIPAENVEVLESELLALQHNVQNRINLLESELQVLDSWQVKREYTRKPSFTQPPARKMQKLEGGDKLKKSKLSKFAAGDSKQGVDGDPSSKLKGETPDHFWSSVDPYCADITEADVHLLQDGINDCENSEELFQVPALGQHYSRRWALEELQEEQKESQRLGTMADPLAMWDNVGDSQDKDGYDSMLKSAESSIQQQQQQEAKSQYGPLTERLIAAFLENPVSAKGTGSSKHRGAKLSLPTDSGQMETFEMRLKKELVELGLLDPPETEKSGEDDEEEEDEILAELERKQAEISTIMEYNRKQREILVSLAKKEMEKQKLRESNCEVEDELTDWLKKTNVQKQKKKPLGRKEKDSIWKAIETRDSLLRKLDKQS